MMLEATHEEMVENYHRFLAQGVFELKGKEFRDFHKNELERLGYPLSTARLVKALFLDLLDFREATRSVRRAMREKKRRTPQDTPKLDAVLSSIYSREN